jgi:AcrR family transcriptional regulator
MTTQEKILSNATTLLAREGYSGTSMRKVAKSSEIQQSVIYNYFKNKEEMLRAVRVHITKSLDGKMRKRPLSATASQLLYDRLIFQFENREMIVALLQYFMAVHDDFPGSQGGYVPARAYQHTRDIIDMGVDEGTYKVDDADFTAKLLTHLVNGFLIEYFDRSLPKNEIHKLAFKIHQFIENSLQKQSISEGRA